MSKRSGFGAFGLVFIIGACAQAPGGLPAPGPRADRVRVESQHVDYELVSTAEGSEYRSTVQFPAAVVWEAVPRAYADLGIPIETHDPTHRFLAGAVSARRAFAKKPLSNFVDCGSTVMGPNANSYNVRLHVQTQVDSSGLGEARIRTLVNTTAASEGGSTVRCSSKGDMERLILDRVTRRLAPGNE